MATAYEFIAVAEEGLMLRCPDCGNTFISTDDCIGCPDCDGRTAEENYDEEEGYDDQDLAEGEPTVIDDSGEVDPCDPYDYAYAAENDIDSGRYDDDPNPYSGE